MEIKRDRWGRPLIIPVDGGDPVPYVRASKLAKALDDTFNLMKWQSRQTALGVVSRPDLILNVQSVLAAYDNPSDDPEAKRAMNRVVDDALIAAGSDKAARTGDALHSITESYDAGREVGDLGKDWNERLEGYKKATKALTVLQMETFVVNDELGVAGSFDRLYEYQDGSVHVGDLKTGSSDADFPLGVTTQVAIYANSMAYNPETGERTPIHPDIDLTQGVLVHMPSKFPEKGTKLYSLDLVKGWEAARLATEVLAVRKWKKNDLRKALSF